MNSFSSTKSKTNLNILGRIGFFEEDNERESSILSTVTQTTTEAISDLIQMAKAEPEKKPDENGKFSMNDSIEDFQKQKAKADRIFYQALKEDQDRAQKAKYKLLFEEEINDIVTNLPTEQKNRLLHYQASYKDRSIYQRAELRKKIIEEQRKTDNREKQASIPSPAKKPHAMEVAFEGGSGTQGSGTANLSFQAVG